MKRIITLLTCLTASLFAEPNVDRDVLSQTLGHLLVRHLGSSQFELNVDKVIQGIRDEQQGKLAPMTEEEYESAIFAISETLFEESAQENLSAAGEFLEKQSKDPTIHVLEDQRLLYHLEKNGEGEVVEEGAMPLIRYKGTLLDGTVFASSEESDQPIALPLQHTIPGFAKGLAGMKEGEKRKLYIHPDLAYGATGHLPPNSLLIFEVEIVKAHAEPSMIAAEGEPTQAPAS